MVREIPAPLSDAAIKPLIADVAEELVMLGGSSALEDKLGHILATMSCHNSVCRAQPEPERDERPASSDGGHACGRTM